MLGIRFKPEIEEKLSRYARSLGKPTSAMARDWILERFERESVDEQMRRTATVLAASMNDKERERMDAETDEWLRLLDAEDGGYDWGERGPSA